SACCGVGWAGGGNDGGVDWVGGDQPCGGPGGRSGGGGGGADGGRGRAGRWATGGVADRDSWGAGWGCCGEGPDGRGAGVLGRSGCRRSRRNSSRSFMGSSRAGWSIVAPIGRRRRTHYVIIATVQPATPGVTNSVQYLLSRRVCEPANSAACGYGRP